VALGTHSEVRGRALDPARHIVGLETDDVVKECRRLKDAGVVFVEEPKDFGNVWVATFKDPEGNLLQLLQFHR
jgi:predicted enzyme related to lactoylglutathione lyase